MTKRLKKLTVAIAIGVVLIAAGIISGVCIINSSVNKRPTYVATAEELVAAINDDIDKPIVLSNDIVVHGDLAANKLFDLEMNDHNLRVIGTFTLKTDAAGEMYVCDGKNQIKKRERVQADKIVIDAVNATITWNANVQLKNGYTADDFVVSSADHTFIFNGLMLSESGDAVKTAMTVKQGRVVVSASDENVKTPAEIVVPADAKDAYVDNKTEAEVNIKASTSVSVAGTVSVDIDDKAENVKITAPEAGSSVTVKSGTAASVEAAGSDVTVDKGATVAGKVTAGKVENNGTVGEIDSDNVTDNSVAIRKADAKTELSAYALAKGKDNYSANGWESVKACVTAGNTAIDAATDIDGVNAALAAAKAEIDKVKTAEQEAADALANKKTETLAALDEAKNNYKETDYREAEWKNVTDAYDTAKAGIEAVTDIKDLPGEFVKTFTDVAKAQKTIAQLELEEAKTAALTDLENCYTSKSADDYSRTDWAAIETAYNSGITAINRSETTDEVATALSTAKAAINEIKKSYAIVYELNGGTNDGGNPERIYDDSTPTALKDATKENYKFMGWYKDEACTEANKVTALTYGDGVTKVYAKWGVNITASLLGVKVEEAVAPGDTFAAFLAECDDIMSYNIDEESGIELDGYYLMKADGTLVKIEADTVNDFSEPVTFYVVLKQNDVRYLAHSDGDNGIYTAEVIGLVSAKDDVTIVAELELLSAPHKVTEIASGVFADVDVKTAYIPATVEKIGASIFKAGSTVTVYTDKTADWADTSWKNGATVTVVTEAYYAASAEEFRAAVSAGAKYIRLTSDITSTDKKDVQIIIGKYTADYELEIDLNGKTLGYRLCPSTTPDDKTDSGYRLKLTINNGQIGTDTGFNAGNGELIYGINMQGNGIDLVLNKVKVIADYGGLYSNGRWDGSTVKATGCEFAAAAAHADALGAVLTGNTTYTFDKCRFVGPCGVYMKSGDYTFTDCEIESTGAYYKPTYQGNGTNNAGSAVVVDNCTGYHKNLNVAFVNCTITSANGYAIEEVSTAKAGLDKVVYAKVTVDAKSVLSGKLGSVYSENGTVTVEGESGAKTAYASTGAGLKTAITSGADYVKLMDDVVGSGESDTDVTVTAKTGDLETVIDLNGKQFGYELNLSTIVLNDAKKYEDTGYTLKVTIKNGKIGSESGYNQDAANGRLYYGVLCQGNGVFLTLENVESSAYYGGLYANGAWKDNVITATDCKFASTIAGCGAYLPGKNTYNFTNCTFSGSVGVYIKSGDATFTDCTIEGKGEYLKPTYNGNGADGEGSGLVVDSTTGYQTPMTVTVNGGSITSANGYAIEEVSNAKDNADKICYSTVTVSKETVLTGKLGKVQSENGTVTIVA